MKDHISETVVEVLTEKIRALQRGAETFRKELVGVRCERSSAQTEVYSCNNTIKELQTQLTEKDTEIARLKGEQKVSLDELEAIEELYDKLEIDTEGNAISPLEKVDELISRYINQESTIKSSEAEVEQLKKDVEIYKEASLKNVKDCLAAENKYRRLMDLMKKAFNTKAKSVLRIHRANEKKLKAQRKEGK